MRSKRAPPSARPNGSTVATRPLPIALLGSGAFAIPSFEAILSRRAALGIEVALVVSQPDRPAGRGRECHLTPVSEWASARGVELCRAENVNEGAVRRRFDEVGIRHAVVIAFGQKLLPPLLEGVCSINLHGSLLPRWRGAAPIQRSLIAGDAQVGVSVIEVTARMDAGAILARAATPARDGETAGELHDRLAALGVEPLLSVVGTFASGGARVGTGTVQDESLASRARKLSRDEAWVSFSARAAAVASRINGLSPWPGVDASIDGNPLKLLRARVAATSGVFEDPGRVLDDGTVACAQGSVELLEVQVPGGRACSFEAFRHGRALQRGATISSPRAPAQS